MIRFQFLWQHPRFHAKREEEWDYPYRNHNEHLWRIESELQNLITAKKVKYVTGQSNTNNTLNDDIEDKIWLFSGAEIRSNVNSGEKEGIGENGGCYDRFGNKESKYYIVSTTTVNNLRMAYKEFSQTDSWWLRTSYLTSASNTSKKVYMVSSDVTSARSTEF